MAYFLVKTLYSILFLLSFSFIGCCSGNHELRKEEREFDYFLLAYLWPGTICPRTKQCCSMNACCRGSLSPTEFTIHGLWTDYNDGTWPACCRESYFDIKKISSLLGTLEKYWPTFGCASSSNCHGGKGLFWEHEWEKHGTCSSPVILDEYNYFSTTLDLYFKYNITKIMNNAGYVPSNTKKYRLKSIISTIQNAVGSSPLLVCSGDAVEELRLCFTKDMLTRECVGSSSCPKYISIPEYTPMDADKSQVLDVDTF